MPLSHDSKPRNRVRRLKYAASQPKPAPSQRSMLRRLRSHAYRDAVVAQQAVERALRKRDISWRAVELAVNRQVKGDWSRLGQVQVDVRAAA